MVFFRAVVVVASLLVHSFYFVKHFRARVNTLIYNNNISARIEWEVTLNNELLVHVDLCTRSLCQCIAAHAHTQRRARHTWIYCANRVWVWCVNDSGGSNDSTKTWTRMGTTATTPSPQNTATQQLSIQSIHELFFACWYVFTAHSTHVAYIPTECTAPCVDMYKYFPVY